MLVYGSFSNKDQLASVGMQEYIALLRGPLGGGVLVLAAFTK